MISKKSFGGDNAYVATSYNNLASVCNSLGEYNRAKELHEKALTIRKKVFGEDYVFAETVRSQLALVNNH